ncbi:MAG: ABC transporter permease [Candidatus Rokubacteria bacterium]|nr:ABC transporter permease [Candidatus Rokubacteria bacterium]
MQVAKKLQAYEVAAEPVPQVLAPPKPRRLRHRAVLALTALLVVVMVFGLRAYGVDPLEQKLAARLAPPWSEKAGQFYPLGTDAHGRDLLARTLSGMRVSLMIGLLSVLCGAVVGVTLGLVAGHFGGRADRGIMLLVDVQLSIPFLLLALILSAILGAGIRNTIIALTLTSWIVYARVARAETLVLRGSDFVQAARALGATDSRIMARHMLPNIASTVIVIGTLEVGRMILTEAALSFLGLGVPPPAASLGRMVAQGQPYVFNAWWFATIPGCAILLMVLLVVFLGDVVRERLEPRAR